jgi:hypothetical protein
MGLEPEQGIFRPTSHLILAGNQSVTRFLQ